MVSFKDALTSAFLGHHDLYLGNGNTVYIKHIDGVRGLALLAVLLFHLKVPGTEGGFVGVDIFFVISGFLITTLLKKELIATGRVSFLNFYARRVRRLIPAFTVLVICTTVSVLVLFSNELVQAYGKSLIYSSCSLANIHFYNVAGYFSSLKDFKPLLHTWSLSVEEQFYFVFPALFVFGRVFSVLAVLIASVVLNAVWAHANVHVKAVDAMFFLPVFRFYEFAIGALGSAVDIPPIPTLYQDLIANASILALAVSVVVLRDASGHPLLMAIPCVASLGVVLFGHGRGARAVLLHPVMLFLGRISYSTYLWHWPIIVGYKYAKLGPLSGIEQVALLVVCVLCGWVSFLFVEQKYRLKSGEIASLDRTIVACLSSLGFLFLVGCCLATFSLKKPLQLPYGDTRTVDDPSMDLQGVINSGCRLTWLGNPKHCKVNVTDILIIGNSHEDAGSLTMHKLYGKEPSVNLIRFENTNGCGIELHNNRSTSFSKIRNCANRTQIATEPDFVKRLHAVVVSSLGFFGPDRDKLDYLRYLQRINPKVKFIIFGDYIRGKLPCTELLGRFGGPEACRWRRFVHFFPFEDRRAVNMELPNYLFIDKSRVLCNGTLQSCVVEGGGDLWSYDGNHMTYRFSRYFALKLWLLYGSELLAVGLPQPGLSLAGKLVAE